MVEAGKTTPILTDELDDFFLNPVWKGVVNKKQMVRLTTPFGSSDGGGDGPGGPGDPTAERPQLEDIQRPITQEIYYENGIAKVRVTMRMYISSEYPIKKFKIVRTKAPAEGGRV